MNSRKIILAKNPKLANSRNSRKFLPKISRIFPLAKVSSAKVSSFKVIKGDMVATDAKYHLKCLVEYKNKYRSFKSPGKVIKESSLIEGIIGCKGAYYISQAGNVAGRPFR